jgi:hypothetical protein
VADPEIRQLFTRQWLLGSEWYAERLRARQQRQQQLWKRHVESLETFLNSTEFAEEKLSLDIAGRLDRARKQLTRVFAPDYLTELHGTLGADRL